MRAALRRAGVEAHEADDLVQDAYCRLASLTSIDHIDRPAAYFMQMVTNIRRDRLRRSRVIHFEEFTENLDSFVESLQPDAEREVAARQRLEVLERLLAVLPERCRKIFTMKRIEGLSQREIATRLAVTENIVENDIQKALRLIQAELRKRDQDEEEIYNGDRHGSTTG